MRNHALWSLVVLLAACSEPVSRGSCSGAACDDVPDDAKVDVAPVDVADDAATDVATTPDGATDAADVADVAVDRAPDAAPDVTADASVDVAPDIASDAAVDVAPDVTLDAAVDVAPDVAPDRADAAADVLDATADARVDVAVADARADAAPDVSPTGGCVSGAVGTHVARFRWTGSGSGSRATVSYEANTLPDRSRWRASANSRSIGYTPVYSDTFLAEGGLDLSGTVFIDVELSTVGLGRLSNVTLALYGRSFNTTASGSFAWQTFTNRGAAPSGLVANSAPYQWYRADATAAFVPGDNGVLLRITPGPPSSALVVSRVEVCFDAR